METIIRTDEPESFDILAHHLSVGRLAVMPCDTMYGIVGRAPETQGSLRLVKGRPETKPFIQLVTVELACRIANHPIDAAILSCWPGPLTVIVEDAEGGSTAVRVPSDPFLLTLLERLGFPLYSTSVNVSGEPALTRFSEMVARFRETVPLFVQGRADTGTVPSTIIDSRTRPYTLVRQGIMDVSDIIRHSLRNHDGACGGIRFA